LKLFFFYKNETKKGKLIFCHLSINCLFLHETKRIYMRAAACEQCVRGRSHLFLFSSLDCFDNQHPFLPSIIFLCAHTHTSFHMFFVFF
jgi:hypothetical protein